MVRRVQQHSTELILETLVSSEHLDHVNWLHLRLFTVLTDDIVCSLEGFRDFAVVTVKLTHFEKVVRLNTNCLELDPKELRVLFMDL